MSLPLNSKLGSYEVRSRLGAGGMGEVYLAYDTKLGRPVALKILPTEFASDRSRMQRFIQEAQAASALNHPNIITIYEIEEADSVHFIATEFVDGGTLHQRSSRSQLLIPECLDIVIQVASALAAAHGGGIVHRDVKPENIMLRRDGLVKLLDFGLAKLTATTTLSADTQAPTRADVNSLPGIVMGTMPYMSPEQARGLDLDARTDIWSLGCVLYEIVTGHQPFTGDTPNDVLATILKTPPAPLSRYRRDAPAKLEEIVVKTLEKSREDRYQSVADLLVDLRRLKRHAEFEAELARSPEIRSVHDEVPDPPRHNLPAQRSTVVGRDRETEEICARMRSHSVRLLTLTGVGGTGKTTLARAVAEKLLPDFADGVFFIDLAAVKQTELVASTIAQPLGVKEGDSRPIVTLLKEYLGGRHMLLVLDNFEQVLSAGPVLAELLTAAPSVNMLVTSRALLQLTFEQEYMVPPLESPRNFADGSPDELIRYDAVKLFVDRTRAAKPNFVLTTDNARTVAGICARLEGLPLGIELAAARMKLLSPQAILARLADRLKLLTGGPLDLPTRQQTMRSTMEWSYDLLTDDEKQLFRRLAVFAGGFSLDSAQKVVGDHAAASADQAMDVLDGLTSLVNKSLLVATEQGSDEVRFRMLAVVREYALDRLEESGEAEAIRQSHAAYFLAFAEEAEPMLQSAQPAEWLRHLDEEYDNIREALRWSLAKQPETAARLAGAVRYFWDFQGRLTEGLAILKEILSLSDRVPTTTRCKMLSMAGNIAKFQGDHQTARKMYEEGLRESRVLNDLAQVSLLCRGLGSLAVEQGDLVSARTLTGEALAAAREANDQFGIARSLNLLGDMARTEGDYPAARPLLAEALEICRATGNKYGTANICNNLAAAEYGVGDYASARAHFAEGLTMAVESGSKAAGTKVAGDKIAISYSLDGFAALAIHSGEAELAAWLAGAAQQLRQAIHFNIEPAERRFREGYLASIRAALSGDEYRNAYEQGGRSNLHESVALALGRKL